MEQLTKAPVIPITETVIFPGIHNRIFVSDVIGSNIKNTSATAILWLSGWRQKTIMIMRG